MPLSIPLTWKKAPFLRLLPPLIAGIAFQWYLFAAASILWTGFLLVLLTLLAFHVSNTVFRFRRQLVIAFCMNLLIFITGALITYYNTSSQRADWIAKHYHDKGSLKAVIQEPLSKKPRSYKTVASSMQFYTGDSVLNVSGNIIVYFSPDVPLDKISYGSVIIINRRLQPVKSSGNPGAFDYERYCSFNDIAYQVYLGRDDFTVTGGSETRVLNDWIFQCRERVISILRRYIKGNEEAALAEALLIGYKDDLDKDLVQAYSNTGVVHIIAVSGLHLGIIYWLLGLLVRPLVKRPSGKWMSVILILTGLWLFSLLAGAGPSVLRSAVMFSFIVIGNAFSKRNSIYNNLASSAFLVLCWNPFWLWDIGFQLSYVAVLSIILFYKPIYNLLYVKNKLPDAVWKLNAVTLSAQVLTVPVCLYHFHQFPNFFLLANLVAVPLSTVLLIGEIILCIVSFIPLLAEWTGACLSYIIEALNTFIRNIDSIPFASWGNLLVSFPQLVLLLAITAAAAYWLMHKHKPSLIVALVLAAVFMGFRSHSFITASAQKKLIVYSIPGKPAIDFISGRNYYFYGDAKAQADPFLRNFHLEPSRILHRASRSISLPGLSGDGKLFLFHDKRIMIMDSAPVNIPQGLSADLLILSGNSPVELKQLLTAVPIKQVVADASNNYRLMRKWQSTCEAIHIPFHNVADKGAFILDLEASVASDN